MNLQRNFNEMYLQLGKKLGTDEVFKFYLDKSGSYNEDDFDKVDELEISPYEVKSKL